jgi:polyisoprenoid-binding protein YceI
MPSVLALRRSAAAACALALAAFLVGAVPRPVELLPEHEVRYRARDQVNVWEGVAPLTRLEAEVDPDDLAATTFSAVVRPADFDSGVWFRDAQGRSSVFETATYPEATFALRSVQGDRLDLPDGAERDLVAVGELNLRGVSRSVEVAVQLARAGAEISALATFTVSLEAFGMRRPRFLTLVADDEVEVAVSLRLRLLPGSTATTR